VTCYLQIHRTEPKLVFESFIKPDLDNKAPKMAAIL
jgi:hypothetical protein